MPRRQAHETGSSASLVAARPVPAAGASRPGGVCQAIFLAVFVLIAATLYTARVLHPGLDSGEFWSDSNVVNACRGYDQVGFRATWGIPRIELGAAIDEREAMYVSYPPGPYWFSYAAWRAGRLVGVDPLLAARLFAQTCGLASALLLFILFGRLTGSRALGALGALFYVVSSPYLSLSAALHHMAYSPMLLFATMLAWLAFERGSGGRRLLWLVMCAGLFFVDCWLNFEHMFFFALFVGVRTAFHFRLPVILGAAVVGPIPIPVMLLRVLHNAQVLGGWDQSMRMFVNRANERAGTGRKVLDYDALLHNWLGRLGWPWVDLAPSRYEWNTVFRYPVLSPWVLAAVLVCLAFLALVWWGRRRRGPAAAAASPTLDAHGAESPRARFLFWTLPAPFNPRSVGQLGVANGLLLLAGGLTWFVVMTQHTYPHRFIVLLLMPGLALLMGTLAWGVLVSGEACQSARCAQGNVGVAGWWARLRAPALVLCLFVAFALEVPRTDVLNHLLPLDAPTRSMVVRRAETNVNVAAAGRALQREGVSKALLYDGANAMPWRAASIGLPFRYVRGENVPTVLAPHEALYLEAFDANEKAACFTLIERFGLPDLLAEADSKAYVYRPREAARPADTTLDVALTPGLTLRSMRSGPTLAGDALYLALWVTGEMDAAAPEGPPPTERPEETLSDLQRFAFTFRARGPGGQEVAKSTSRLAWSQVRSPTQGLLMLTIPAASVPAGSTLELAVWDRRERGPVPLGAPGRGTEVRPHGRVLRWPTPAR